MVPNTPKTMNASTFQNLTKTEQVIMVIQNGEELLSRNHQDFTVHLYMVSGLFVELWYETSTSKIVKTRLSSKDKIIEEYPVIWSEIAGLLTQKNVINN